MANSEGLIQSINPASGEIVGQVKQTTPQQLAEIVSSTRAAANIWGRMSLSKRADILRNVQQLLLDRQHEVARLITSEMGRPLVESLTVELPPSIDLIGYYARRANRLLAEKKLPLHHPFFKRRESRVICQPLGVLGIISPWNWPLLIPLGCIVPALMAGNGVIFKPSELTPLVGQTIRELFLEAGLEPDVFQVVQGRAQLGKALVESTVDKIFFTGSTEVGIKVMQGAAGDLKNVVLELGGSDPAIVCHDANLDICTSGILWGAFNNCGQNCNGVERVFVDQGLEERFTDLLISKVNQLRIGNGLDENVDLGPLVSLQQQNKMTGIVERARSLGAQVLVGGRAFTKNSGAFFEPTILRWQQAIPLPENDEIFGPIVHIIPVKSESEAVELANRSNFGLAASVWTQNAERGRRIARQLEAGSVMINDVIVSFGITEVDWTGIKRSGVGWVHGDRGFMEMVNAKYINRNPQSGTHQFWWFPYSAKMSGAIESAMKFLFSRNIAQRLKALTKTVKAFGASFIRNRPRKDKL